MNPEKNFKTVGMAGYPRSLDLSQSASKRCFRGFQNDESGTDENSTEQFLINKNR